MCPYFFTNIYIHDVYIYAYVCMSAIFTHFNWYLRDNSSGTCFLLTGIHILTIFAKSVFSLFEMETGHFTAYFAGIFHFQIITYNYSLDVCEW